MMNRRTALKAGLGAGASAIGSPSVQAQRSRPNFIIILTDDHGYHDLGCAGATELRTPNLDALAATGARFTDWYSNAPMCAPSRAAMMTGRFPVRCGVPNNVPTMPTSEITLGAFMKAQGYATGIFGKWHIGETYEGHPNSRGFDEFFGFHTCDDHFSHRNYWSWPKGMSYHDLWHNRTEVFEEGHYSTEMWTEHAIDFIDRNAARPFFIYLAFNAVHYPMHAPKRYLERCAHISNDERRVYAAMLACVDDNVGRVLETLDRHKLRDNTFIVFTSDNGATRETRAGRNKEPATGGSNYPHRGAKFSLFEGGIRMPAIMNWPGHIPGHQVISEMVMTADVFPTFAAAADAKLPADRTYDGRNILPVAAEKARSPHEAIYWYAMGQSAMRRGQWKYINNVIEADGTDRGLKPIGGADSIYLSDLSKDPGETHNLRNEKPELVAEMAGLTEKWLVEAKKP